MYVTRKVGTTVSDVLVHRKQYTCIIIDDK